MFSVRMQCGRWNSWKVVAYYDNDWHFRSLANRFEDKKSAEDYLKLYDKKVNGRRKKERQKLKVFDETLRSNKQRGKTTKSAAQEAFQKFFS
jgi:hypothetical protein